MIRLFLGSALAALALFSSEPSAFEAGNLDKENPYGLTESEKHILKNKEEIKRVKKELFGLKERLDSLEEKNQGLQSVVEGIDERLNKLEKAGSGKDIEQLRQELNETLNAQNESLAQMKKVLTKMGELVDTINSNYVSKDEFNKEMKKLYALLQGKKVKSKSGYELYTEAYRAYKKHDYKKAKELFALSIQKGYKPATSSFYLGESCYYSKDYKCAINYYKKSASLYQKSKFMPTLLLHTAISLDRLGDKKEAKKFYESVVKLYPDTKAAKIAKRNLSKMKN